mgnify:CR=1 FL=1
MSLNTALRQNHGKKEKLEELAKEFSELVSKGQKKEALEFYRRLDKEVKRYIENTWPYSGDLKSAQLRGF